MRIDLGTANTIGRRAEQEDSAAYLPIAGVPHGRALVVADGLGGHAGGANASSLAVTTFVERLESGAFGHGHSMRDALGDALQLANARIGAAAGDTSAAGSMGTTIVAAVLDNGSMRWVSVGDSHLYLWRAGRLAKLNADHSQAGQMILSGKYAANSPEVDRYRSLLRSALLGRRIELIDLPDEPHDLLPGDIVLLASDGLNTLSDQEIQDLVAERVGEGATAARISAELIHEVLDRGSPTQDNTTIVVARIEATAWSDDDRADEPPTTVQLSGLPPTVIISAPKPRPLPVEVAAPVVEPAAAVVANPSPRPGATDRAERVAPSAAKEPAPARPGAAVHDAGTIATQPYFPPPPPAPVPVPKPLGADRDRSLADEIEPGPGTIGGTAALILLAALIGLALGAAAGALYWLRWV